jgi:hypothetical protein
MLFGSIAACGTEDTSLFPNGDGEGEGAVPGPGGSDPSLGGGGGGGNQNVGGDPNAACATTSTVAQLTPVNMVVAYDRSGSMGDTSEDPSYDPKQRWLPVGQAMKSFFTAPGSGGVNATLTFFPSATNSCSAADYGASQVATTALPSPLFAKAIDTTAPKGDTPTRAAIAGAIAQAKAVAQKNPGEKTVIVLVTDGEPYGCGVDSAAQSDAEAQKVAQDVAAVKATLPTYVIGVGPSTGNLDAVATAGGTKAFHVQVGNPAQTSQQLLAAMSQISGALASCDFAIPNPPDGRKLDYDKVNVERTSPNGPAQTLPYSADCKNGVGWHYDDAKNPKKVLLCGGTCDQVKKDAGGKVNVAFSCVDRPGVVH